jgi:hypothetical protein
MRWKQILTLVIMSNPGKRPQPSSGTPESGPSKRTSEASRNSPSPTVQAAAALASTILPIPAFLNSSHPASSLPGQPELPLRSSRQASPQPERALQGQPSLLLDSQPGEGAGRPVGQYDFQSSLQPGFTSDGGADPISTTLNRRPSGDAGPLSRGYGPQSSLSVAFQPSGRDAPPSTAFIPLNREQFGSGPSSGPGLPLIGRLMPQPRPRFGLQPSGGAGSPPGRPFISQPSAPIGVQPSRGADPQLSMDFFPRPSIPENHLANARPDTRSSRVASSQRSQGDDGRKRMDLFRYDLLRDIYALRHMAMQGEHVLSNLLPDVTTVSEATKYAQVQARTRFLISDAKERSARLANQFRTSYCPLIRDSEVLRPEYYDPEICRMFKSHTDPRARLLILEAKAQSLRQSTIDTNDKLDLYCQYSLVIDEERNELLNNATYPNTHSQSTYIGRGDLVGGAAQAHSRGTGGSGDAQATPLVASRTVQGDGSRVSSGSGHGPWTSLTPARVSRSTEAYAAQGSPSGISGTQNARPTSHTTGGGGGGRASPRRGRTPQTVPSRARQASPVEARTAQGSSSGISGTRGAQPTSPVASRTTQSGGSRDSSRRDHAPETGPSRARRASPIEAATQVSSDRMSGLILAASTIASEDNRRWETAAARALVDTNTSPPLSLPLSKQDSKR